MNAIDDRTLEALVDGELSEAKRAAVLQELDQCPDGWRRLGLVFLADQTLRQTFATPQECGLGGMLSRPRSDLVVHPASEGPRKQGTQAVRLPRKISLHPWVLGLAACAACALLAFFLGAWSVPAREIVVQAPLPPPGSEIAKATSDETRPREGPPMPTLTTAARKELERRGFIIQERPRVVPVQHQDGRTIKVLVNEIEVRYVGRPSVL